MAAEKAAVKASLTVDKSVYWMVDEMAGPSAAWWVVVLADWKEPYLDAQKVAGWERDWAARRVEYWVSTMATERATTMAARWAAKTVNLSAVSKAFLWGHLPAVPRENYWAAC